MVYRIVLYVGPVYYEAKAYMDKSKYIKSSKLDINYVDRIVGRASVLWNGGDVPPPVPRHRDTSKYNQTSNHTNHIRNQYNL